MEAQRRGHTGSGADTRPQAAGGPRHFRVLLVLELDFEGGSFHWAEGRQQDRCEHWPGGGSYSASGRNSRQPAWRAGRNSLGACRKAGPGGLEGWAQASEVTSDSGQPGTGGSSPSPAPPLHGKLWNHRGLETEPHAGQFPHGLPAPREGTQATRQGGEGPSVPKRDSRSRHPAPCLSPGLLPSHGQRSKCGVRDHRSA